MMPVGRQLWKMQRQRDAEKGHQLGGTIANTIEDIREVIWDAAEKELCEPDKHRMVIEAVICKRRMIGKWQVTVE